MISSRATIGAAAALAALAAGCGRLAAPVPEGAARAAPAVEIASPAGPRSGQPSFDATGAEPILSWTQPGADGRIEFRLAFWKDGAFVAPRTVAVDAALLRDPADAPGVRRLADGSLFAYWSVKHAADAYTHDLLTAFSRDGGSTWSAPVRPHRDRTLSEHGFAAVVPDPAGPGATIVWLDGRDATAAAGAEAATALYAAHWDGATFGPERRVDPRVCDCCRTAALATAGGALVAYRDRSAGEIRDVAVAMLSAAEASGPRVVHDDGWTINACPTNGPAFAAGATGTIAVAWFTAAGGDPAVWAAWSRDRGASFAPPIRLDAGAPIGRVDAATTPDGVAIAWLEKAGTGAEVRARLVRPGGSLGPAVVASTAGGVKGAGVPRAALAPDGRLLVAWTDPMPTPRVRIAAVDLPL